MAGRVKKVNPESTYLFANIFVYFLFIFLLSVTCKCRIAEHRHTEVHKKLSRSVTSLIVGGFTSQMGDFFVRIVFMNSGDFCGGTLIRPQWVITAGQCVVYSAAENVSVEVTDFTQIVPIDELPFDRFKMVSKIFTPDGLQVGSSDTPKHDIALLKLTEPVHDRAGFIRPCHAKVGSWRPLHAFGLGATSGVTFSLPRRLKEGAFHETFLQSSDVFNVIFCREFNVCTESLFMESNMCLWDQGGPLVSFFCGTTVPECLYGVTSYFLTKHRGSSDACNGGSTFTSIPYFYNWIQDTIEANEL
ncbi:trypsin-like [Convolutriloba macropyga]|uniref:trypsin-like n=1 Tax=Convolutriloba macropyga TaxID=536237 RepID=UPI003F51B7A7